MRALAALKAGPLDAGTAHFDPSNLEVVTVDTGNPSANVIPAECRARFNVRFNDVWTPETLSGEIRRRVAAADIGAHRLTFAPCNALAFLTEPGDFTRAVAEAVLAETGVEPVLSTTGGTSDARFIARDCPVVEFGLVGQTMHAGRRARQRRRPRGAAARLRPRDRARPQPLKPPSMAMSESGRRPFGSSRSRSCSGRIAGSPIRPSATAHSTR